MNGVLNSRSGLVSGAMVTLLGVAAACSGGSSGGGTVQPPDDDAGGSSSGTSSSGTNSSGSSGTNSSGSSSGSSSSGASSSGMMTVIPDGGCPAQTMMTLGAHVTFPVTWPASAASVQGTGMVSIWLLSTLTLNANGTTFTGTATTCGTALPDIALDALGAGAVCAPGLTCPTKVSIAFNNSEWDTAIKRTFATSGTQTGWNPGDTLDTNSTLGILGLTDASFGGASPAAWPAICASNCTPAAAWAAGDAAGSFTAGQVVDDDGDGFPGITANPLSNSNYSLPPTSITAFQVPPLADKVYIVSRNQLALSGMRMSSCTGGSGTASITLFDNHVVGCHSTAGAGQPAGPCTSAQVSFLDQNRTIYGPDATHVASMSTPISGTVTVEQLPSSATCAMVRGI